MIQEGKRITPVLPIVFARAKTDIALGGHRIPEGWLVCLGLHAHHMLEETYREPTRFDQGRFKDTRAEHELHEHAFAPQGPGELATSHKCAGLEYSTLIMKLFTVLLLRGHRWELPQQDLALDMSKIPPEPRDGLKAHVVAS